MILFDDLITIAITSVITAGVGLLVTAKKKKASPEILDTNVPEKINKNEDEIDDNIKYLLSQSIFHATAHLKHQKQLGNYDAATELNHILISFHDMLETYDLTEAEVISPENYKKVSVFAEQFNNIMEESLDNACYKEDGIIEKLSNLKNKVLHINRKFSQKIQHDQKNVSSILDDLQTSASMAGKHSTHSQSGKALQILHNLDDFYNNQLHSLKGRFSVVRRYKKSPDKIQKYFLNKENIEEIKNMINGKNGLIRKLDLLIVETDQIAKDYPDITSIVINIRSFFDNILDSFSNPSIEIETIRNLTDKLFQICEELVFKVLTPATIYIHKVITSNTKEITRRNPVSFETDFSLFNPRVMCLDAGEIRKKLDTSFENIFNNSLEAKATEICISDEKLENGFAIVIRDNGEKIEKSGGTGRGTLQITDTLASLNASLETKQLDVGFEVKMLFK